MSFMSFMNDSYGQESILCFLALVAPPLVELVPMHLPRCAVCHRRFNPDTPCPRDGWTAPPRSSSNAARVTPEAPRVEGLTIAERIGRGGFADVWAARRDSDGTPVALKVGLAATTLARERFHREASALERVGAPHAATLYSRGALEEGHPFLAMERISGRTLAAELAGLSAPPDPDCAARLAAAILTAVDAAHRRGVVHRDLKPENLFLSSAGGHAVLIDFGLATCSARPGAPGEHGPHTRTTAVVGTPAYMAPEQIQGDPLIDERADLYAFGVILFELLTLRLPFAGDASEIEHGHLALRPPRPGDFAQVPPAVEELTLACLAKDPCRRPASAAALRRALRDAWSEGAGTEAIPLSGPRSSARGAGGPTLAADGHQPVALLVAEVGGAAAPVFAAIAARGGFVARQRGRRYVGVFPGKDVDDPARAALAAARELVDQRGARAALHVAGVRLRPSGAGPPAVYGAPVERPETWTPPEPWSGVALTGEFERALPEQSAPASVTGDPGREAEAPLLGRDGAISRLAASAAAAFEATCPGLLTVIGDAGLGKTRLAVEAARVATSARADALVLSLRAAHPIHGGAEGAIRALLRGVLDAPEGAPSDPRAFCEERLGEALGAVAWPAVAAALGWAAPPGDPGAPRSSTAPGPHRPGDLAPPPRRHGLMQALAEGLRRRARSGPVAVILDDADLADDVVLDAIEYATLDGAGIRLWAVVVAGPRLQQARPGWGGRSQRHDRLTLAPLDEAPAMELAARLLLPAEYPPAETLRRLSTWAGGNPACLREIVRSLKGAGAVRRRSGGGHYLATAEIDALPPSPAWQWLAARRLGDLSPELAACARVCAALGSSFDRAELEQVLEGLDREGGAGTPIDAGFGLEALVAQRILQRGAGDQCSFRSDALRDAIHEGLDPGHRARIHRHALSYWRARADAEGDAREALEPLAKHAVACGERAAAADAYLRLGDIASARHRHVEADQRYTAALAAAEDDDDALPRASRARALAARGRSRYRNYLAREARADFAAALAIATALGDRRLAAHLLLEDATALDWMYDFDESARRVEEARPLVQGQAAPALEAWLLIADGRTAWRKGRQEASIRLLDEGIQRAVAAHDHDAEVVGLLILSFELACSGSLDEAEARFDEVIARATAAHDLLHLCTAYTNRIALWIGRWSVPGAVRDLRRAIDLAREIGNPWLEKLASYNVALLLHWSDRQPEALVLARRARWLEERSAERPLHYTALLLAEILISLGEYEEAGGLVSWVERTCPPGPSDVPCFHMLQLVLSEVGIRPMSAPAPGWDEVTRLAQPSLSVEGMLRLLYWRARMAVQGGRREEAAQALDAARLRRAQCPMWLSRFESLEREAAGGEAGAKVPIVSVT